MKGHTTTDSGDSGAATPVRVLIVAPSLRILGGQAVQAKRLIEYLALEPTLSVSFLPINPQLPGPLAHLQRIKYLRTILTSLLYLATLIWRVRRYDIIHIFSASYFSFVLAPTPAILVAKLYRKKIILNYRSGEAEDHLRRWRRTAIPTIKLADAVVVPSGYLVGVFAQFGIEATSIFNVVDPESFRYRARRTLRPVILSNRNLEPMYNVGCALKAFYLVRQRYPDAQLVVAGQGSQRASLETLTEQLGLEGVSFVGAIPARQMNDLYHSSDVYLNSSDIDNMPGSIIEAYSSGLPVVTTNAGGIPFIVAHEETGLMVERGDFKALAASIIRLIQDESLAFRIASNAKQNCENYTWPCVRKEWLSLYSSLVTPNTSEQRSKNKAAWTLKRQEVE